MLANKQDAPDAQPPEALQRDLGLDDLKARARSVRTVTPQRCVRTQWVVWAVWAKWGDSLGRVQGGLTPPSVQVFARAYDWFILPRRFCIICALTSFGCVRRPSGPALSMQEVYFTGGWCSY